MRGVRPVQEGRVVRAGLVHVADRTVRDGDRHGGGGVIRVVVRGEHHRVAARRGPRVGNGQGVVFDGRAEAAGIDGPHGARGLAVHEGPEFQREARPGGEGAAANGDGQRAGQARRVDLVRADLHAAVEDARLAVAVRGDGRRVDVGAGVAARRVGQQVRVVEPREPRGVGEVARARGQGRGAHVFIGDPAGHVQPVGPHGAEVVVDDGIVDGPAALAVHAAALRQRLVADEDGLDHLAAVVAERAAAEHRHVAGEPAVLHRAAVVAQHPAAVLVRVAVQEPAVAHRAAPDQDHAAAAREQVRLGQPVAEREALDEDVGLEQDEAAVRALAVQRRVVPAVDAADHQGLVHEDTRRLSVHAVRHDHHAAVRRRGDGLGDGRGRVGPVGERPDVRPAGRDVVGLRLRHVHGEEAVPVPDAVERLQHDLVIAGRVPGVRHGRQVGELGHAARRVRVVHAPHHPPDLALDVRVEREGRLDGHVGAGGVDAAPDLAHEVRRVHLVAPDVRGGAGDAGLEVDVRADGPRVVPRVDARRVRQQVGIEPAREQRGVGQVAGPAGVGLDAAVLVRRRRAALVEPVVPERGEVVAQDRIPHGPADVHPEPAALEVAGVADDRAVGDRAELAPRRQGHAAALVRRDVPGEEAVVEVAPVD